MTLKKKILVGYGAAFVLMGLVVAWSVINIVSLGKATDAILSENYRSILAAENMVDALERQDSGVLLALLGDRDNGTAQFRNYEAEFWEWLARAKDNITVPGEAKLVSSIESGYRTYRSSVSALVDSRNSSVKGQLPDHYQRDILPNFEMVRKTCIDLRNLNEKTMYNASLRAGEVARNAIWSTLLVAGAALVVALIFSLVLAERIVQPIRGFMEASRNISSGNYEIQVPVKGSDEFGHLASEFNAMAMQLGHFHAMNIEKVIAEKNKSEAILASIEDGLIIFDTQLRAAGINQAARSIFNVSATDASTLLCDEIIHDSGVCEQIRSVVISPIPAEIPDEQRVLSLHKDNRQFHYLFSITVIRGADHTVSGIVLLLRDITRLKEVEQLKNEFVMAASHELRTPLTSLGMSVDLLLEHAAAGLAEKDRELLQAAHEEVHRMKALVNDLLDLSRIEAGRIQMEFESVPVSTLFGHVQAVFKSQMEMKNVTFTCSMQEENPNVRADANKAAWVLSNLVSNALRYVPKGGHISLRAHLVGQQVHLSVKDDGPGIPPEYQAKIFHKFVQVKGQEPGGTGLGLAICKEIVRAHGGAIWVDSVPGQGSSFTFTLPVAQ